MTTDENETSRTELQTQCKPLLEMIQDGKRYQQYFQYRVKGEFGYAPFDNERILELLQEYIPGKVDIFINIKFGHKVNSLLMDNDLRERSVFAVTYNGGRIDSVLDLTWGTLSQAMDNSIRGTDQELSDKHVYTCTAVGDGIFTIEQRFSLPGRTAHTE